jgi:hypothetical protein
MNSPGFTAEVSLSESNEQYELIANKVHFSKSRGLSHKEGSFPVDVCTSATGFSAAA